MLSKNNEEYSVSQMLMEVNSMKEDKMYKKMYLEERVSRLRAEMALMQERFSVLQVELQNAEKELQEVMEFEKPIDSKPLKQEKVIKEKPKK